MAQQIFPGEFVYDNPLLTLAKLDPLSIEVVLPERLFGTFKPGGTALIYAEIDHEEQLHATEHMNDPLLATRSGTFSVRLTRPHRA